MRPTSRLFELIEILRRAREPISAADIAEKLEVSKRTVYRDIAILVGQHVPIVGEAGVGYVLQSGFHLPPLALTTQEIEAAILGAQWVTSRGEPELANAASSLLEKMRSVVSARAAEVFLEQTTSVGPAAVAIESFCAAEIRAAIRNRNKIWISYADEYGHTTQRVVWPIVLGYRDVGRIMAAWCELRKDFRFFRTERIINAKVLDQRIPERMSVLKSKWRIAMEVERNRFLQNKVQD